MLRKNILVLDEDIKRTGMDFIVDSNINISYSDEENFHYDIGKENFNIVILCRELLGCNIYKYIRTIKNISPDTCIFFTTSKGDIESYIKFLSIGVCDYFIKPINHIFLKKAVNNALGRDCKHFN